MATKTLIKEVYQKAKTGQFAEVLELIKGVEVVKDVALNILILASNACYNSPKDSSNIDKDEVYNLLNNIICSLNTIDESQLVRYLQSVFHIIKYMCDKEWFEDLTKMEFIIVPTFLTDFPLKSIEGGKFVYQSIINKLCSSLYHLAEAKKTIYNTSLLGLIKIIFKANSKINGFKETLTVAHKFLNILRILKIQSNQLCAFYFILLDSLTRDLEENNDYIDEIPLLIHIFSIILSDIIQAKEFQSATEFLDNVETRIKLNFTQQEFLKGHLMFRAVTAIFPSNTSEMLKNLENCKANIKYFKTCHKNIFFNLICFLEEPLYDLLSYYKSSGCKIWCDLLCDTIIYILRLLREDICCLLVTAPTKCSCGCSLEKNYCGTLKIGCQIAGLLKYYLGSNKCVPKKFCSEIEQWQTYFYEILVKVKAHYCRKWSQIYKELGTYTYNIGTALYHQENVAVVDMYQCFLKYSLEFEGFVPEILKPSLNEVTFNVICELEDKNRNLEKCMAFAALYCLLYPQKSNSIFHNWWIKAKLKVKEDSTIQQQTLVSILEKHGITLSGIVKPEKYLNGDNQLELLSYELLRYKTVWKSKESLMAAFSHLIKIAEVPKIAQVILEIFGDGELQLHEEMPAIFSKVRKKIQASLKSIADHHLRMALAVLYYYNYKDSSRETADKNLEEMEKTMQVMESAKEKFELVPKDPNDECDIVSAYSNLRLDKFTEILNPLNKCVEFISSLTTQSYEPQIVKNTSKLLTKIGFDYRLHCFSIKSLQAFELSLKFAQIVADSGTQLLAISFLIENADIKRNFVMAMIRKGDELAESLKTDNLNDRHSKTLAIYQISKAKAFLYDDANLSLESWKIADTLVTVNETKDEFKFLRAELFIVHYKLTKSCGFIPGEHAKHPMTVKLHCAMDIVINLSQKKILCSYELCILLDTVYALAKVYYLMRLPRDLRAYSKNSVLLTQKIVLPMRCASFLILLAHSDLLTCKFDHCNVKLNGVNDIFCMSQSRPIFLNETMDLESDTKIIDREVDRCVSQIQEMALDLPQHTRQYSPSSPALVVESFKAPQFLSHEKTCMCFICLSFEYHQMLLQKYHLDALFDMYQKDEKVAEDFIQGALMLYKTLMRNYDSYREKAKSLISESLISNFNDSFREYYGNILYDYSFHLMRKSQKSEALNINTELVQLLKPKKLQYVYLYNDALLQRLSYIMPAPTVKCAKNEIETEMKNLNLTQKENISLEKTPTSKKNTVTVTINGVPKYSPPQRKVKKKCALFNSPIEKVDIFKKSPTQTPNKATSQNKMSKNSESESNYVFALPKTKKIVIPAFGTPLLEKSQTPKIPIFSDGEPMGSIRKSRRQHSTNVKKEVSIEKFSEPISSIKKAGRTVRKKLNSATFCNENNGGTQENCGIGYTQQPRITDGPSKTRNQMLTQKIKASTLQSNSSSTLTKRLVGGLLTDKLSIPINRESTLSSTSESETSSVISESPEHEIANTKSKVVLEKVRISAKKANDRVNKAINIKNIRTEPEVKKNLLGDFLTDEASGSKSTKHTGAIRKSSRHRVL